MGRRRVGGPVAFMPSDGKFWGSKDLEGIPVGHLDERLRIRVIEVVEYDPGEEICGRKEKKAFWAMAFERPPRNVLMDLEARRKGHPWERSRKEWKFGPTVARRLQFRLGDDVDYWPGAVVPVRLEVTDSPQGDVYCIRPVPLPLENHPQKRREAMEQLAAGTYRPPGLCPEMLAKWDADNTRPAHERQPGEDEGEPPPADDFDQRTPDDDPTEPPADWQGGVTP